jgi:hypothetical protein
LKLCNVLASSLYPLDQVNSGLHSPSYGLGTVLPPSPCHMALCSVQTAQAPHRIIKMWLCKTRVPSTKSAAHDLGCTCGISTPEACFIPAKKLFVNSTQITNGMSYPYPHHMFCSCWSTPCAG